jgi:exodeoxyribonuclease-3|nr:exodeoxyribonuclease III [Kofleriaceae bacterium]
MKIGTWNVNGLRKRAPEVLAWLDREQPDVACLQEIKCTPAQVPEALRDCGYHAVWHGAGGYSGVALLLRRERYADPPAFFHPPFDVETRIACAQVGDVVLASAYFPNGGKDYTAKVVFLRAIAAWAGDLEAAGTHLVLCGDFNVARTDRDVHPVERKPVVGQTREERELIDELFSHALVDVGRLVDPDNDRLFTWWAPWRNLRQRNIGWRLDYVAASAAMVGDDVHCAAYREVGTSDHAPVIAHLRDAPVAHAAAADTVTKS